jgi:hypothetical protein
MAVKPHSTTQKWICRKALLVWGMDIATVCRIRGSKDEYLFRPFAGIHWQAGVWVDRGRASGTCAGKALADNDGP